MIYNENGNRYKEYYKWGNNKKLEYDYENEGILKHLMSPSIVNSQNHILVVLKTYYEKCIIFLLKYVDRLKHFKNYHWKNR